MNLFTALLLSTRQQAESFISRPIGVFMREAYRMQVSDNDTSEKEEDKPSQPYQFEIFAVTYPDHAPGKGWGDPKIAREAHFSKKFSEEELLKFCEKHEFAIESGWQPLENN